MADRLARLAGTHEMRPLAVIVVLGAYLSFASPGFFTLQNLSDLLTS
jgi:ribose/xylose/arabinose/galactoside ABC-type transport system permease subunit